MSDLLWKYSAMAVLGANNLRPCIEHSTPNIVKRYLHVWSGVELNSVGYVTLLLVKIKQLNLES